MPRPASLLAAAAALLLAVAAPARAAYLQRPEQDCLNPMVAKVNQFDFFPDEYRSMVDKAPAHGFQAASQVGTCRPPALSHPQQRAAHALRAAAGPASCVQGALRRACMWAERGHRCSASAMQLPLVAQPLAFR
jgi:hypothetical protein